VRGQLRIDELFAFTAIDSDGTEGVTAFLTIDETILPMVAADRARVDSLRPIAQDIARQRGVTIRLVRFSVREVLEEIKP